MQHSTNLHSMKRSELIERYAQAVRTWLPRARQQDILSELLEDLRSEIEDKEGELGRELSEDELEVMLKRRGAPFVVAHSYLPQRCLVGPVLYPIYLGVLKWFALVWVVPSLLLWLGWMLFSPDYRAHQPFQQLRGVWLSVLYMGFNTTLAFAIVERFINPKALAGRDWSPRRLPPAFPVPIIPRANSLFALALYGTLAVWCLLHLPAGSAVQSFGSRLTLTPAWPLLFWFVLAVAVVRIGFCGFNLVRPCWTKHRLIFRLIMHCFTSVVYCVLFKTHLIVAMSDPDVSAAKAAQDVDAFNAAISKVFWLVLFACIAAVAYDLRQLKLQVKRRQALAAGLAALALFGVPPHDAASQDNRNVSFARHARVGRG